MVWVLAARSDPAFVFISGRCSSTLFDCEPHRERQVLRGVARACDVALSAFDRPRNLSPLNEQHADQFHLRRHADADRSGLYVPVSAGLANRKSAVAMARSDSVRLLAGMGVVPGRSRSRRTRGLAA